MSQYKPTVWIFGKSVPLAETARDAMSDDIDVPRIFAGASPESVASLNSSLASASETTPDFIFTGLGFSKTEFERLRGAKGAGKTAWVYGNSVGVNENRAYPPLVAEVVERMKATIAEVRIKADQGKGKSWTWGAGGAPVEEYTGNV